MTQTHTPDALRERVAAYYAAISRRDIDACAAMFAADAEMRDPVGMPGATDDAGRRQRYAGIDAAFATFNIAPDVAIPGGDEIAVKWTARGVTRNGARDVSFEGISTFVFDGEGRIACMSAYWDTGAIIRAMAG